MSAEYWFARRFPLDDPRRSVGAVHWKGFAVAGIFAAALLIGAIGFAWMAASGYLMQGAVVFMVAALVAGGWFITVANAKADHARTVEDYRKAPQRV